MAQDTPNRNPVAQHININTPIVIQDKRRKIKDKLAKQEVLIYEDRHKDD